MFTVAQAKVYLNTTVTDEDDLITQMVAAAVRLFEDKTHRTLITHKVETIWQATTLPLRLYSPPVQSVTEIATIYQGTPSVDAPALAEVYVVGSDGLRPTVHFTDDGDFAASNIDQVRVTCECGYGDSASDVPQDIIIAIKSILSHFYDHRDEFEMGQVSTLPWSAQRIINDYEVPGG